MAQRTFEQYFDHDTGLLCTWDGANYDGGDTAQKTGLYRFGLYFKFKKDPDKRLREQYKFEQELTLLECPELKGWYIRSPSYFRAWWRNPYCFSRDQHRSLVIAMGAYKQQRRLWRVLWEHVKRGFLYQNNREIDDFSKRKMPDVTAPDHLGEILRALYMSGAKWLIVLWPLLLIADLSALVGLLLSFPQWKDTEASDDDDLIMSLLQAKYAMPTPISWFVRKLYKLRPLAGTFRENNPDNLSGPASAIAWKHRVETGAPPFADLYLPILKGEL